MKVYPLRGGRSRVDVELSADCQLAQSGVQNRRVEIRPNRLSNATRRPSVSSGAVNVVDQSAVSFRRAHVLLAAEEASAASGRNLGSPEIQRSQLGKLVKAIRKLPKSNFGPMF